MTTIAMSMLVHGEAVRFNRRDARDDDFDFKYMRGRDGSVFPYVSSQCYKKYWRESLEGPFSPIKREQDASGKDKNHAFTSGDPIAYIDDDLFGYMIAGATENEEESGEADSDENAAEGRREFDADNLKDAQKLRARLLDGSPLSNFIVSEEAKQKLESAEDPKEVILQLLDDAAQKRDLFKVSGAKASKQIAKKFEKQVDADETRRLNREILLNTFKELKKNDKRATTRRTAPVRMHALVAFSGIKIAKDFQTFSRDIAYSPGKNSILNPSSPGIYSGWLKTRILIEAKRIGRFDIGPNMDILDNMIGGRAIHTRPNPYSREQEQVKYIELDHEERTKRLRAALRGLADIGNRQGPASGALHDGSLRPRAFVAAAMTCADSPFDYVWRSRSDDSVPDLDVDLLCENLRDWNDLFATNKIYIGLPPEAGRSRAATAAGDSEVVIEQTPASEIKQIIEAKLENKFTVVCDTTRQALLKLAAEAAV
jgi:hypothetical protein